MLLVVTQGSHVTLGLIFPQEISVLLVVGSSVNGRPGNALSLMTHLNMRYVNTCPTDVWHKAVL